MKYLVTVRALCNFTAKHGDLDLRFTPAPTAQEGMAGHALVASRRDTRYQSEVLLAGDYKTLSVRGRADGYDPDSNQLEEVKTYRGDLHAMADNKRGLHWAQVKIYGWLLCQAKGLKDINLALVYFDIASTQETPLVEHFTANALKDYFENQCELFLAWAERELVHRAARDAALTTLTFPHATFRPGQRELAEAVYKTASNGKCLMAQATTGIGKTIGTVFPLLKAIPTQRLDKLFFLAAKTPGRKLALDALELIEKSSTLLPLRVVELVAAGAGHPAVGVGGGASRVRLQGPAVDRGGPPGAPRVDDQQVALPEQRVEQRREVGGRAGRRVAGAALHGQDRAGRSATGRAPGEAHSDRGRSGVGVVERDLDAAAPEAVADRTTAQRGGSDGQRGSGGADSTGSCRSISGGGISGDG